VGSTCLGEAAPSGSAPKLMASGGANASWPSAAAASRRATDFAIVGYGLGRGVSIASTAS